MKDRIGNEDTAVLRAIRTNPGGAIQLDPLDGTRKEVEDINRVMYPSGARSHVNVRAQALESRIKRMSKDGTLKTYRYVHLAMHSFVPGEISQLTEPCLAFSMYGDPEDDGFLKMSEISGLEMDADMVVLSACKTGVLEKNEVEEGLSGLSRVFFYAGTPRLAVTLWPIADEGTQALMEAWYKRLKSGTTSTLESLNAAKQDMLASKELSHPFFWAPFILLGESK